MPNPQEPLFIVGSQRSGTTLLRIMLDHHSQIACPHELDYAVARVSDRGEWPDLDAYHRFLETNGSFRRSGLHLDRSLDYPTLMQDLLVQHQGSKPIISMSVHEGFHRLPFLWPGARYVHLLRDPRDVARSVVQMEWATHTWGGAGYWLEAERDWDRLTERVDASSRIEVTYEALVREPERTLTRICTHLGVEFEPGMLDYAGDTSYERPRPELAEQWRRRASDRDVQLVEARLGELLTERGYTASGLPSLPVGDALRRRLQRDDRLGRIRLRIRRQGPMLFVADYLARKLHLRWLELRTRKRILESRREFVR